MNRRIKNIYKGLPIELTDKVFWVAMEFQTNSLSHTQGGSCIVIEYKDDSVLGYKRVKKTNEYIHSILTNNFISDIKRFEQGRDIEKLEEVKTIVRRIYATGYQVQSKTINENFLEIWNSDNYTNLPWDNLKESESLIFEGLMAVDRFKEIVDCQAIQLEKCITEKFFATKAGHVYVYSYFDSNKDAYITMAGKGSKNKSGEDIEGTLWLVNKDDEISWEEYMNQSGNKFYDFLDKL